MDEKDQAVKDLASIRDHQEHARRRARLPWWAYAAMFGLIAAGGAANDFVTLNGAKLIAVLVLLTLVAVLAVTFITGSAPLSSLRGVQPRQSFAPRAFIVIVVLGAVAGWLIAQYGPGLVERFGPYPYTVAGLICGALFTGLFALSQRLTSTR